MAVTPKMERFARLIALEGLNQSQAYRQAYNVSPTSAPRTVWDNASQLAHNTEVAQRIAELRAAAQAQAVVSASQIIDKLKAIGFAPLDPSRIRPSDKVAALDKMAKILGLYRDQEPERTRTAITQVNIILDHGDGGASTETHRVVEGVGRMLEPSEEEPSS